MTHEYIDRSTGKVQQEKLVGDRLIGALYSPKLENAAWLSSVASSRRISALLGYLNFDNRLSSRASSIDRFLRNRGVDFHELVDPPGTLNTPRKLFERQIRYWDFRPLPQDHACVVCPADSRVAIGSIREGEGLPIKEKFFAFPELLGGTSTPWTRHFQTGDYAVFRLTPEKYHYTHVPAAGMVRDFYAIDGRYHPCNPNAAVQLLTPHSRNRRFITILDTDSAGGAGLGLIAMVEVVALMVGQVEQRYSEIEYRDPRPMVPGMFLKLGAPKALFRPGSSTVVLLFQKDRVRFAEDLHQNQSRRDVRSRYTAGFGQPLVETDVLVRSSLATSAWRNSQC